MRLLACVSPFTEPTNCQLFDCQSSLDPPTNELPLAIGHVASGSMPKPSGSVKSKSKNPKLERMATTEGEKTGCGRVEMFQLTGSALCCTIEANYAGTALHPLAIKDCVGNDTELNCVVTFSHNNWFRAQGQREQRVA